MSRLLSLIIFFLVLSNINVVYSQDNSIFFTHSEIKDTDEYLLSFDIKSTSFLKNNEYFEEIRGWTGIGFILEPKLKYQPSKTTIVEAGYFFEKYSGRSDLYKPIPLFRIRQKLTKSLEVVMGHLYGNLEHKLTEPMFRFDRYYSDNIEYGIQFLYSNKYVKSDLWMNWEKFIFYDDPFKEEFVLGNVSTFSYQINNYFGVEIPIQYTWTHAGGQIDKHDENRGSMMSLNNKMIGLKLIYTSQLDWINKFSVEYAYLDYNASANPPEGDIFHQLFDQGYGHYLKANIDLNKFKFMLGYWKGHNYISRRGEELFASTNIHFPNDFINDKELYNFKFIYDINIKDNIVFSIRSDLYYKPETKNLFYSYAFYFVYNDSFVIRKMKKG